MRLQYSVYLKQCGQCLRDIRRGETECHRGLGATPAAADTEPVPASEVASAVLVLGRRSGDLNGRSGHWSSGPGAWPQLCPALSLGKPVPRILIGDRGVMLNFKPAIVAVLEQEMKEDFSGRGKDAHIIMMICLRNSLILDVNSQVSNIMIYECR